MKYFNISTYKYKPSILYSDEINNFFILIIVQEIYKIQFNNFVIELLLQKSNKKNTNFKLDATKRQIGTKLFYYIQ